jgi:hypothetical protein
MEAKLRNELINLLETLMTRPAAQIFIYPVVPGEDCPPDYLDVIRNPTSLNDILTKLEQNEYPTLDKCLQEIELCWANTECYNGASHPIAHLAGEMRQQFQKLFRPISVRTIAGFCAEVYRIRTRIGRLLASNPVDGQSGGAKLSKVTVKQFPTEVEMQTFITACELLTDARDHETIRQIVEQHQPDLVAGRKKVTIVMTSLRPETFRAVKVFVRTALKKQGLEYPS